MKNLFSLLLMSLVLSIAIPSVLKSNEVKSQLVTTLIPSAAKDTTSNTDTADVYISTGLGSNTAGVLDNISRSATAEVVKISGTVGGKVYLQGLNAGTNWENIDSLTLSNKAIDGKTFPLRHANGDLLFKQMRFRFMPTGTQSSIPKVYYLRRSN